MTKQEAIENILTKLDEIARGFDQYEYALPIYPDHPVYQEMYDVVDELIGKIDE